MTSMKKPSRLGRAAQDGTSRSLFDEWVADDPRWAAVGQMTDEQFHTFLGEWLVRQPDDEQFRSLVKRAVATARANAHLRAYKIDRNPEHILKAVGEYLSLDLLLPAVMHRNLRRALAERHKKPAGKPKTTTLRQVYVAAAIAQRYGGAIPEQLDSDFITMLARQHGVSGAVIKNAISRLRKAIANPQYERARAFRG
jgi:hypothetical protein